MLDWICLPRKTSPIHIELPPIHDLGGGAVARQEVLRTACSGELLFDEAQTLSGLLEVGRQYQERQEREARRTKSKRNVPGLSLHKPVARRFFNQLNIDAGRDSGRV